VCTAAFESQIGDATARVEFTRLVYSALSNAQQKLANPDLR
jgi:hypothetical protein